LLLAATLSMILTVVLINRLVWRRLYRLASERFRLE
jgi:NitT/TauT family transport system permease protein